LLNEKTINKVKVGSYWSPKYGAQGLYLKSINSNIGKITFERRYSKTIISENNSTNVSADQISP
jgi:hypothetical protein